MLDLDADGSWSNWSSSVSARPARVEAPKDESDAVAQVRKAAAEDKTVRVVGSGHSGTPLCATDGVLMSLDAVAGIESQDAERMTVTVGAGSKLCDLGAPLLERGLSMENLGDIDKQSVAGAIGTGTHGTGRTLRNISSQLDAVRLVDAAGELRSVSSAEDPDLMCALRVSLGAFGVFTAAELRVLPAYRLHENVWRADVDECFEALDSLIADNRHFEFFWIPFKDQMEMKTLNLTDAEPDELADQPHERIGWAQHIIASERDVRFFEMEYAVPAEAGPQCFHEVRERMQKRHTDVMWPIEYRTVAPDDAWLSPAGGRETVTISVHQDGSLPYKEFFEDVEPIFWQCGGRPHWGKIHSMDVERLSALYPDWERFQRLRESWDPGGRFLNPYLQSLFGI